MTLDCSKTFRRSADKMPGSSEVVRYRYRALVAPGGDDTPEKTTVPGPAIPPWVRGAALFTAGVVVGAFGVAIAASTMM